VSKAKPHTFPPPAPIGNLVCCWPQCSKPIASDTYEIDEELDMALGPFPLCAHHANVAHASVQRDIARTQHRTSEALMKKIHPQWREVTLDGWIYYVRIGDEIKIGYTKNVRKRMHAYPPAPMSELLAVHPGTLQDEAALHQRFTPYRSNRREWYERRPAIMRHIADVVAEYGPPPDFDKRRRERDLTNRRITVIR